MWLGRVKKVLRAKKTMNSDTTCHWLLLITDKSQPSTEWATFATNTQAK